MPARHFVDTATAVDIRTEPGPGAAEVERVLAPAVVSTAAAVAGLEAAELVFLAGSWHRLPGTTAPMQPSLLAGSAGPVPQAADHTVQELALLREVGLEDK